MAKQTTKTRKKKKRVIDASKLRREKEVTVEIEIEGRTFLSVIKVSPESSPFEIELAKANLKVMIERQYAQAKKKRSKWLRLRRWFLDLFTSK